MERLGILGGSFDPPHLGHLTLARAAVEELTLDRVLWVPAGQPPHKRTQTPVRHRLAMTELAIAGETCFELCRLDLDRPGPHYTADLLALLRAKLGPEAAFWFLVGEDSLRDLPTWYAPRRILQACRLAVYPRPAAAGGETLDWERLEAAVPGVRGRVDWLSGRPVELASSQIRQRARQGQPIADLVTPAVLDYIRRHRLYRPTVTTTG